MNNVTVSVEVPLENLVHEITYDGQEILQTPLTMSENLSRLAAKIDFVGKDDENVNGTSESNKETAEESNDCTFKTTTAWPWESVHSKIRTSLTELSVLSDILTISQQKKYLVLDPVQAEPPDPKPAATLIYKKKGLSAASSVLLSGFERLRTSLNEARSKSSLSSLPDFHIELLRLRQNWRLRKVGNSILGDLSYRTAGSRFPQAGIFEVTKAEDHVEGNEASDDHGVTTPGGSTTPQAGASKPTSALRVTVPNELQGIAYIQVLIQKDQETLSFANIGLSSPAPVANAHWQQRLEAAQNVLFCRELFSVLAREAVTLNSVAIPPLVVGNQITATLFPGILLIIGLCHSVSGKTSAVVPPSPKLDHNHVLEHSLHQLLREVHRSNSCIPLPHPSSASIGVSRKRRLAGPLAYDRYTLTQMTKKESILEEMIRQSQHVVLRLRTMYVLDTLSREVKDPLLVAHWSSLNAVTHSCVRITLMSSGYDMCVRTPLVVHVKEKSLKCILKDGKAINLSYEPQELRDVLLAQISVHQVMALQSLSKCMGWLVLSSSPHLGVGTCESLGNVAGCLLSSQNGKRMLGVRSTPNSQQCGIKVFVGYPSKSSMDDILNGVGVDDFYDGLPFDEPPDHGMGDFRGVNFKSVDLEKLEGKNFLNKMEMLMAVLADVEPDSQQYL